MTMESASTSTGASASMSCGYMLGALFEHGGYSQEMGRSIVMGVSKMDGLESLEWKIQLEIYRNIVVYH